MSWKRFDELLVGTVEIVCALLLIFITVLTLAQVVMRYIFNNPFTWSEELSIAAFIYLTFLGISVAYARDRHLCVDAFVAVLPRTTAIIVNGLVLALSAGFFILVSILMIKVIVVTWKVGITTAALEIPRAFIYLSLPLGCVLFLIQVLKRLRNLGRTQ
jgi:TRAP-type C4-dicarboxylate transport system permease small subunit